MAACNHLAIPAHEGSSWWQWRRVWVMISTYLMTINPCICPASNCQCHFPCFCSSSSFANHSGLHVVLSSFEAAALGFGMETPASNLKSFWVPNVYIFLSPGSCKVPIGVLLGYIGVVLGKWNIKQFVVFKFQPKSKWSFEAFVIICHMHASPFMTTVHLTSHRFGFSIDPFT